MVHCTYRALLFEFNSCHGTACGHTHTGTLFGDVGRSQYWCMREFIKKRVCKSEFHQCIATSGCLLCVGFQRITSIKYHMGAFG